MKHSLDYRGEIDGLRALSVLAITLYHLEVNLFQGGFVGVDVFFVISGFLITRLIVEQLAEGGFRFRDFYLRRSARILPALLITVLVALSVAAWFQTPEALLGSARQALAATLSLSNFYFWGQTDYWARGAQELLFLHTWSLGVEEQFYLVYPLLLVLAYRFGGQRAVTWLLLIMFAGGALANELARREDPSAAFYWSPLRLYEFALGALGVRFYPRLRRWRTRFGLASTATGLGLLLIIYAALLYDDTLALPGLPILLPCAGALLVLLAGPSSLARVVLGNRPVRWLGRVSYSVYLVHWPVLVIYRDLYGGNLTTAEQLMLLGLALALAQLLHTLVENRFRLAGTTGRTRAGASGSRVQLIVLLLVGLNLAVAAWLLEARGLPGRYPPEARALMSLSHQQENRKRRRLVERLCPPADGGFCGQRGEGGRNIWLLGDSRGLDAYLALRRAYPGANIMLSWANGCAPVFDAQASLSPFTPDCHSLNLARLTAVEAAPAGDVVFLAQSYLPYRVEGIFDSARRLAESGKRVYLLGDIRFTEGKPPLDVVIEATRRADTSDYIRRFLVDAPFGNDAYFSRRARDAGATYISSEPLFHRGGYRFQLNEGGDLLTYDGKHLSRYGSRVLGDYLARQYPSPW